MKIKQYPQYKKSELHWFSEIPGGWSDHKIKFILERPVTDGPHETPEFIDEGVPFLSVDSIQDGEIVFEGCRCISEEDYQKYKIKCNPKKNDLFMGKAASIGKIARVKVDFPFSIWSPLALLRPNKRITPRFFEYALKSDYSQDQIDIFSTSNTQKNISMDDIPRIQLLMPNNVKEQNKITLFLDSKTQYLEKTIEKDKQLIELMKERRNSLIDKCVKEGLMKTKLEDSKIEWLGKIPSNYQVNRLKFLVSKINSGLTPTGGSTVYVDEGIPFLRSQNIHFNELRLDNVVYIPEDMHKTMLNSVTKKNDVLINITGASIGRCAFVSNEFEKANVNQHVCIIRTKKTHYKFLSYFLMSKIGQDQVFSLQMGSSREGLNFEQLGNFIVITPPKPEQEEIVKYLDEETSKIDNIIKKIEEKIILMEEYKKSMIHHVVTGKVDVRGVEI